MLCFVFTFVQLAIISRIYQALQEFVYLLALLITILIMLRTLAFKIVPPELLRFLELAFKVVLPLIMLKIHPLFLEYVFSSVVVENLGIAQQGLVSHNVLQAILEISLAMCLMLLELIFVKKLALYPHNSGIL